MLTPPAPPASGTWWLIPAAVFEDGTLCPGRALAIEDGVVTGTRPAEQVPQGSPVWRTPALVAPGFLDLQVNGGGGVLFNADPSAAGLDRIGAAHAAEGTARFLPTVITDAPEVAEAAAEAVLARFGRGGVAGLHLEGPHIATARAGIHDPRWIRPFERRTAALVARLRAAGVPVIVTLAPEAASVDDIAALAATGAVVSLGHSDADAAMARRAIAAGATMVTHLFNAMAPMLSRAPGLAGAALDAGLWCGLIADGHHVDDMVLRIAMRGHARPERLILVSDAMPSLGDGGIGGDGGDFTLQGRRITLSRGRLTDAQGRLAGAHLSLGRALSHAVRRLGVSPDSALSMAVRAPAQALGLAAPGLAGPASALVLIAPDFRSLAPFGGPAVSLAGDGPGPVEEDLAPQAGG